MVSNEVVDAGGIIIWDFLEHDREFIFTLNAVESYEKQRSDMI